MPTTLITTPGDALANSYAGYDDTDPASPPNYVDYWTNRPFNTVPLVATQPEAEAAMIWAEMLLDYMFKWTGAAVDETQALAWPRSGMKTPNGFDIPTTGVTSIPTRLKTAQILYAGILLSGDRTLDDASLKVMGSELSLTSLKVGPVSLGWSGGTFTTLESFDAYVRSLGSDFNYLSKAMPDAVRQMIPPSWYVQTSLKRKAVFAAFGSENGDCR
jgi:hypothetical protein